MEQLAQEKSRTEQVFNLVAVNDSDFELNGEYLLDYETGINEILADIEEIKNGG